MRYMFEIHDNPVMNITKMCKALTKIAYRLIVCFENKDKHGNEANDHYHGYIELNGKNDDKKNYEALRHILRSNSTKTSPRSIDSIPESDEKATLSYVTKQKNIITEYNTSYDIDELEEWWNQVEKPRREAANKNKKQLMKDKICEEYMKVKEVMNLQELKVWVARYLVDLDLLPVMSKVRAYSMYVVHKCNLKHLLVEELDKLL